MANTSKRGFASMEGEKQRVIASKGGRAAHAKGTAHEWSSDEARAAGRKGGESRGAHGRIANGTELRSLDTSYAEQNLASNFLTNAGRSLRAPSAYSAPGTNGQPALPNTVGNIDSNGAVNYSTRNAPGAYSGVRAEQTA